MSKLKIYHPNAKGMGSALTLELHPAHDEVRGNIVVSIAAQKAVSAYEEDEHGGFIHTIPAGILPTFNWENAISVKLDANELAQMIEVLRGYKENLNDGKGFFHRTKTANICITFKHCIEPLPCYVLNITRKEVVGETRGIGITLTMSEAIVLNEAISQSLVYVAFGVPSAK